MAFFTSIVDLQGALSTCLTVRDWEMLIEDVQMSENFVPCACNRRERKEIKEEAK